MAYITLKVTGGVIRQVNDRNLGQRQIAIHDASPELLTLFLAASATKQVFIAVNNAFTLSVGDTRAIWGVHQTADLQRKDFGSLYDLLARRPDRPVRFAWDDDEEQKGAI